MAGIVGTCTFLLAVAFSAEILGYRGRPFNVLLGIVFLALFLWPYVSRKVMPRTPKSWVGCALSIAALVGVFCSAGWVSVLFISLLIGGVRMCSSNEDQDRLGIYQATALAFGALLWFWRETGTGWYVLDSAARCLIWVTQHIGLNAVLGPTALGMPIMLLLLTYGIVCAFHTQSHRLRTTLVLFASLVAAQIVFIAIHSAAGSALSMSLVQQHAQGTVPVWSPSAILQYVYPNNLQWIAFLLGLVPTILLSRPADSSRDEVETGAPRYRWPMVAGAGALMVGASLIGFVPPHSPAR